MDEPEKALVDYAKAVKLDEKMIRAFPFKGLERIEKGDLRRTLKLCSRLIIKTPRIPEHYAIRGIGFWETGDRDKALTDINKAVRMDPDNPDILCVLGILWGDLGKHDEAIHFLSQAARLAPKDPYPLLRRAEEYRVKGNEVNAEEDYRRATRIDPKLVKK